ncbi:uncharacterized protein LOC126585503 isoform X4 [Malus sylvestris]|uniref:uncharacterized protein LOC126585503 isoform X4 n=1 Tax=Malus sylvestris TaxID=3752 RepID=UPI0021AC3F22|nr:uncharacterized protein LOC126585503 isoform X4 [Malus sylvestris]
MNLFVEQQSFPGKMQLARIGPRFKRYWNATGGEYREDGKEVCSLMPCRRAVVLTIGVNKHHLRSDYELKKCVVSDPEATFTTWSEEYGSLIWQI